MKTLSLILILLMVIEAQAYRASSALSRSKYLVSGEVGMAQGGIAFGGEFEFVTEKEYGVGGYGRFNSGNIKNSGITSLGGFIRPHFNHDEFDFFISPGFGLHIIDHPSKDMLDQTVLGPALILGATYQITRMIAVGFETMTLYGMTQEDYQGLIANDFLFKVRFGL